MRRLSSLWAVASLVTLALATPACKDAETQATETREQQFRRQMYEGRRQLADGAASLAVRSFTTAASLNPKDPAAYLMLAESHREAGNEGASLLALKQAAQLSQGGADPSLRKQLADLYARVGEPQKAVSLLEPLRDGDQLNDTEIIDMALLQGHSGDVEGGFKTLEKIQKSRPDDADAKIAEAELLLLSGDEVTGAKLMDRIVVEQPQLVPGRLLRARYFLNNDFAEQADAELRAIPDEDQFLPEVVELRARALFALKRYEEAAGILGPLVEQSPRNADLLGLLAELKLILGDTEEAELLVERSLGAKPHNPKATFVQARAQETKGNLAAALETYREVLKFSPGFAPAYSRMWRIYEQEKMPSEAMDTLAKLFYLNGASLEEKARLAELSVENKTNLGRAKKLADELVRREPKNERYKKLRAALTPKHSGPEVIRGKGRLR